jgi:serine/threonine protein kinase
VSDYIHGNLKENITKFNKLEEYRISLYMRQIVEVVSYLHTMDIIT